MGDPIEIQTSGSKQGKDFVGRLMIMMMMIRDKTLESRTIAYLGCLENISP